MKPLSKEVSREELLHMREEGLTNKQIAERLGCNYYTVLRYIGKQPDGMRADYGSIAAKVTDLQMEGPKPEPKRRLTMSIRKTRYYGENGTKYNVYSTGQVDIDREGLIMTLQRPEDLEQMICELIELAEIMKEGNGGG